MEGGGRRESGISIRMETGSGATVLTLKMELGRREPRNTGSFKKLERAMNAFFLKSF